MGSPNRKDGTGLRAGVVLQTRNLKSECRRLDNWRRPERWLGWSLGYYSSRGRSDWGGR